MKRLVLHTIVTIIAMLIWAGFIFYGTIEGFFNKSITEKSTTKSYIEAVTKKVEEEFVGNFAMAVMKNGSVEEEIFYSIGIPVDRNTVFQVSSLSKWVSAVGVMKLVEEHKLELDEPVSTYLTRWQLPPSEFENDKVTVRRLLSHTAGLTDGLGYSGFEKGTAMPSLEESLTKAPDADPGVSGVVRVGIEPGSEFRYSGGGYTLLQLLVEEVTGKSFDVYMRESLFEPLGMMNSFYNWNDSMSFPLADFYHADGRLAKHYRYTSVAATSLYTTLADLEIFLKAHLSEINGKPKGRGVVKQETLELMRTPHASMYGAPIWGLGTILFAETENNNFIIGHDGKSTPPINTATRLDPATGDGIIILETGNPILATRLASEWVFWKHGKVDTLLFPILLDQSIAYIGYGCLFIFAVSLLLWIRIKKKERAVVN